MRKHCARPLVMFMLLAASVLFFASMPSNFAHAQGACRDGYTLNSAGVCTDQYGVADPSAAASGNPGADVATSCSGFFSNLTPTCIFRAGAAWLGAVLISLAGLFLALASTIFNLVIDYTIVRFDTAIYGSVSGGIQAAWTAFRDLANIAIIGIFTFVAIEMILGTQTFGGRRTVAKVLIVAVLINFSLLFSRIIVESANFVARQFHDAVSLQTVNPSASGSTANPYGTGISGRLSQLMGVAGFKETGDALWKSAEDNKSGVVALGQGILTAIIFVAAGAVFLYGAFLLVARAILLIFLVMTSSLAFAAYLLPKSMGEGYWSLWWKTLIQNAILAPLLIVMLWATLQVSAEFARIKGSGEIGNLISNPADTGGLSALFGYLIILGMLYASFRVSSGFAKKIAGFDYASVAPAFGAGILARIGGVAGRQIIGGGSTWVGNRLEKRATDMQKENPARAGLYSFASKRFQDVGKRDFNAMRTSLGAEIQKTAGIKKLDTLAGKPVGGFVKSQEERAKAYAKEGERRSYSPDEIKEMRKQAREEMMKSDPQLKGRADTATEAVKAGNQQMNKLMDQQKEMEGKLVEALAPLQKQLQLAQQTATKDPSDANKQQIRDIEDRIERENSRHKGDLNEQKRRIAAAKEMTDRAQKHLQGIEEDAERAAVAAGKLPQRFKTAEETAADSAHSRFSNLLARATGLSTVDNDSLAKAARKQVSKQRKEKDIKSVAETLRSLGGESAPPPASEEK